MESRVIELIKELRGVVCRCGRNKPPGKTFCHSCYHSLTDQMKRDLYKRVGQGYEQAYDAAVLVLAGI